MNPELERAKRMLSKANNDTSQIDVQIDVGLNDYVKNAIKANALSTMNIRYEIGDVLVTTVYPSGTQLQKFSNYNEDAYRDFCNDVLNIDQSEKYNCSRTLNIDGVKTRVFAIMPPFSKVPNVTISTTKIPPETLSTKQTISDELFNTIVHSNFIIVGASGSGKTYLMNYLLHKFVKDDERILLIEEFGELIPPNDLTSSITVPPPKPGEESLLKFVTEQSNLMRLDAVYVGEIKSGEAWPFIVNLASGTRGGCTLHGKNARDALSRLRALCKLSCDNDEAINEFIAKSINYIIVMKDKNIEHIHKLQGTQNRGNFSMQEIGS